MNSSGAREVKNSNTDQYLKTKNYNSTFDMSKEMDMIYNNSVEDLFVK